MNNFYGSIKDKWREYVKWCKNRALIATMLSEREALNSQHQELELEFALFKEKSRFSDSRNFKMDAENMLPCLTDKTAFTGFDKHYIYHLAWASRILIETKPSCHVDIGSSLYFSSMISSFVPMTFVDYRPANLRLEGLHLAAANLTALPFADNSFHSVSCMHVLEHVGLGRYGDPIEPLGDLFAIKELSRITSIGGSLLVVVPVGVKQIAYNAHRIYDHSEFVSYFQGMEMTESALICDESSGIGLLTNPSKEIYSKQEYGCGCYCFKKRE